jgi:hypothetical protein
MPFRHGLPLLSIMVILHWTVSQSIFVVQISSYLDSGSPDIGNPFPINGLSCLLIFVCECPPILVRAACLEKNFDRLTYLALLFGLALALSVAGLALRKLPEGMPRAATCSAAVSAACHPPMLEDKQSYLFPVQWGVVGEGWVNLTVSVSSFKDHTST